MYEYTVLPTPRHIRLVILDPAHGSDKVSCTLQTVLPDKLCYEALSYVWGDASNLRRITVSGEELNVTVNLYYALQALRHVDYKRVLWVDAICINQADLDERSSQVQMMGHIYGQAEDVVIWLGGMAEDVKRSFDSIRYLDGFIAKHDEEGYSMGPIPYDKARNGSILTEKLADYSEAGFDWEPVLALLGRPWFQRQWVVQEVIKARRAILVCGDHTLPWEVLEKVFGALKMHGLLEYFAQKAGTFNVQNVATLGLIRQHHHDPEKAALLLDLITDTRHFFCTDSRDKIFALLGIAKNVGPEDKELTPNYRKATEEVFTAFTVWNISRTRSLHSLSYSFIDSSRVSKLLLPSWVPDYTLLEAGDPLVKLEKEFPFNATQGSQSNFWCSDSNRTLHVSGCTIDVVQSVGSIQAEIVIPDSLDLGHRVIQEQDMVQLIQNALWVQECVRLANPTTSPEKHEAFWRTLIRNRSGSGELAPLEYASFVYSYCEFIVGTAFEDHDQDWYERLGKPTFLVDRSIIEWQRFRRFCVTKDGRFGWVPKAAVSGDVICLLQGGQVPYVVRLCDGGVYKWVGECYVHGIMEGEAMPIELQEFVLQ